MQDLGIRVLFMGNNFTRLLQGLWVAMRISLISVGLSMIFGIILGVIMTSECIWNLYESCPSWFCCFLFTSD